MLLLSCLLRWRIAAHYRRKGLLMHFTRRPAGEMNGCALALLYIYNNLSPACDADRRHTTGRTCFVVVITSRLISFRPLSSYSAQAALPDSLWFRYRLDKWPPCVCWLRDINSRKMLPGNLLPLEDALYYCWNNSFQLRMPHLLAVVFFTQQQSRQPTLILLCFDALAWIPLAEIGMSWAGAISWQRPHDCSFRR